VPGEHLDASRRQMGIVANIIIGILGSFLDAFHRFSSVR
jgi:uncharacterized membrane protein YeaQ/YmgE (transglycosylase-associated protein family)